MVRCGIGLYGFGNSAKEDAKSKTYSNTKIHYLSNTPNRKGETVGYNRSHIASSFEKTATIPIGHADGISRQLWKWKRLCICKWNQKAAIIGNVCMDMIMVNITDVDCEEGDEVIIFDGIHKASTFAEFGSTISYEVLTAISQRVKRLYAK